MIAHVMRGSTNYFSGGGCIEVLHILLDSGELGCPVLPRAVVAGGADDGRADCEQLPAFATTRAEWQVQLIREFVLKYNVG